jgi:ribosomal subunit interface protein
MSVTTDRPAVEVTLRGNVGEFAGSYARSKVVGALEAAHQPVLHAHVVLDWTHDPARPHPAVAEATVDVNGTTVRARTTAPTMNEAVDALADRLRRRLVQLRDRRLTARRSARRRT